jgi:hypothetical protein
MSMGRRACRRTKLVSPSERGRKQNSALGNGSSLDTLTLPMLYQLSLSQGKGRFSNLIQG